MRPIIGITCNYSYDGSGPFADGIGAREQEWQLLADDYVTAVELSGGLPVIIPLYNNLPAAMESLTHIDGIIVSGGNDIDSNLFGQFPKKEVGKINPRRDLQDIEMTRKALTETGLPVLGICRGIQVMNVAMGGTLHQHLPSAGFECHSLTMYRRTEASHTVSIAPDSLLYSLVGDHIGHVNSLHHQAVDRVADAFKAVAVSPDGVVEAIELVNSNRFVLGVQWHPEMMFSKDEVSHKLVAAFVQACTKR